MSIAITISGGGSKGAFAVGAVERVLEELKNKGEKVDLVSGTSTGALIAPFVALGDIQLLRGVYSSVHTNDIILDKNILNILFSDSIYDTSPLARLIDGIMDTNQFSKLLASSTDVYVSTVSLQSGQTKYWNPKTDGASGGPMKREDFVKAMLAAASMPVFMPLNRIGSDPDQYVDGGVREYTPIDIAVQKKMQRIYAIVLNEVELQKTSATFSSIPKILLRVIDIFQDEIMMDELEYAFLYNDAVDFIDAIRKKLTSQYSQSVADEILSNMPNSLSSGNALDLYLIQPKGRLDVDPLFFEPFVMAQMIEMGRQAADAVLSAPPRFQHPAKKGKPWQKMNIHFR